MTRKELIYKMFYTQYEILKTEIEELQQNLRYRKVSTTDCLELIIAMEKFTYLRDMSKWVFQILQIDEAQSLKKLFEKYDSEQKKKIMF